MKIFIIEYIVFVEDFDLSFLYDNFFSEHYAFLFQKFTPFGWANYKQIFLTNDLSILTQTSVWHYTIPLYKFRILASKFGFHLVFAYHIVPKIWFRQSLFFSADLPYQYIFVQFYNLNYLMGSSYLNFETYFDYYDTMNIRFIDIYLLWDVVNGLFPSEFVARKEQILVQSGIVFYRLDPYRLEWLRINIIATPALFAYSCLNPAYMYLAKGVFYARKWLIYAYLAFNSFPDLNRSEYMYNLSSFFNVLDFYKIGLFDFDIYYYLDNFVLVNFNILIFYLKLNLFIIFCFTYIYFCDKNKLFYYAYLTTPLYFFSPILSRILVVSSFLKRYIRLNNYYWLKKKFKRGFQRKSETENYYFTLIKKHLFRRLFKLYNKYILNGSKYLKKLDNNLLFNSNSDIFIYWLYVIFISFFFFFLNFIFFFKNIIYYIYYFYHLRLNKYVNYKNSIFFFLWFVPEIVLLRDVESFDSFEVLKRYISYKKYYRKKEYRKYFKSKVLDAYETHMWEKTQIDENMKQQYVNYFYHRYFFDYEPWYEFIWILLPRYLSRIYLQYFDPTLKNMTLYHVATILSFRFTNFFFLKKFKNYRFMYILNNLFSFNFWKLYYFYVYKLTKNKSNNSFKFLELWLTYLYKWYLYICLYFSSIFMFLFTPKRIIIPYYFFKALPVAYEYLNKFLFFFYFTKFILLIWDLVYLTLYYSFEIVYVNIYQFYFFIFTKLNNFVFFLFRSDYGFSFNFWYNYYILKFYLIEYNIIYYFFIFIRNLIFNFIIICSIFYIFFSLPFVNYLFYNSSILFFIENIFNFLYNLYIISFIDYISNIDNLYYFDDNKQIQYIFDNFITFYTSNFSNYFLNLNNILVNKIFVETEWAHKDYEWDQIYDFLEKILNEQIILFKFEPSFLYNLHPWIMKAWILITLHLYLSATGNPAKFMMWEVYWFNLLPAYFHWLYDVRFHAIYLYLILPGFWIWQYSITFITFYCLYITSFILPLYYLFLFFFKFMYIIYSYVYLFMISIYYFYSYYFFTIYPKLCIFLFNFSQLAEVVKYDSLKFYITLDILNFIKLIFNSIYIFLYYFFSGILLFFYKILSLFIAFFGFDYTSNFDYFSYSYLQEFRLFTGKFFTDLLPLHYDLNEYNGIFDERIHNRVGKRRGIKIKNSRLVWYPYVKLWKYRTLTFEYKIRGFLFKDTNYLYNMFLYEHLFEFRNWNLFYFMLFSIYFNFFLVLFFSGILFIKFIHIFKDTRHISHSGSYEWKRNFTIKNKIKFGLDDFYWLYNVKWLKSFEFYLDKHFTDDLYVYRFKRSKLQFGIYLYETLNDVFLTGNTTFSDFYEDNRYYKFRKYYFDRYTIFVKDIDYLFHIYSVSKRSLKQRSRIFSFFDFLMPFFKKKKNNFNYIYDNEILHKLDRIDLVWLFYVTPYFLYGRDWYDMKIFSKNLVSKELYAKLKKSLFKAYAIFEMNQKEFPFDLFEFQFFDKDFYNVMLDNYGNEFPFDDVDSPVLSKLTYSRYHSTLLYTSIEGINFKKVYNLVGYEKFLNRIEDYFIYLKKINKNYFNNFIDFSLFSFMESISYTLTHINPNIAKTAVDIDRGKLIGVSYKKSMLLDEFTSTEITESVFNAVDGYLKKSNFKNIDVYNMLLREDRITVVRSISPLWIILTMIPFFFLYLEFGTMFRYTRFIVPHFALVEAFAFITDQIFGIYLADNYAWHGIWIHDHRSWSPRLRYQFKLGHIRTIVWDLRWANLQSLWHGENAYLVKDKLNYSYLFVYWFNDSIYREWFSNKFWNYHFKDFFKYFFIRIMFFLIDFFAFIIFSLIIYVIFYIYFNIYEFYFSLDKENFETEVEVEYRKTGDAFKTFKIMQEKEKKRKNYRNRDIFIDINREIDKHKKLVEFIEEYKEEQIKKEENKKNL